MRSRLLLTGTRAPATLDLARRLHREGVHIVGADTLRFPLGRFSNAFIDHVRLPSPRWQPTAYVEALQKLVTDYSIDLIWPTCEEVFHIARLRDRLSAPVLAPSAEILELLHHKLRFALWTQEQGLCIQAPESWEGIAAPALQDLIWKPKYSRFAAKTSRIPPADRTAWMAQRLIQGQEFCSWAFCFQGKVRAMTQYVCPVRSGRGAGCAFVPTWHPEALLFTQQVAQRLQITGCLAFDFMHSTMDGHIYVLECNPRLTSGIHLLPRETSVTSWIGTEQYPSTISLEQKPAQLTLPVLFSRPSYIGSSPDILWDRSDPAPTAGQLLSAMELIQLALRQRIGLLQATTADIEYNGPRDLHH